VPPRFPPPPERPGSGKRPPRPPRWKQILLYAGLLLICWIVGWALGGLAMEINSRWVREARWKDGQ
jgi:hypothetical protein